MWCGYFVLLFERNLLSASHEQYCVLTEELYWCSACSCELASELTS